MFPLNVIFAATATIANPATRVAELATVAVAGRGETPMQLTARRSVFVTEPTGIPSTDNGEPPPDVTAALELNTLADCVAGDSQPNKQLCFNPLRSWLAGELPFGRLPEDTP